MKNKIIDDVLAIIGLLALGILFGLLFAIRG
jgi:hypothetical protein